jgi:hypothetical protein
VPATGAIGRSVHNFDAATGKNNRDARGTDHDEFDAALWASESTTGLDVHL